MRRILLSFLLTILAWSCSNNLDEAIIDEPVKEEYETWTGLQIVMFTPSDVELPADFELRMKEVTDYAEWFFGKWMNYWEYPCKNPLAIHRNKDGFPILWRIKGKHPKSSGTYDKLGYAKSEVIPKAIEQYGIPQNNQGWWIFSYPGPASSAFRGGGNFQGGTSSANFTPNTGELIQPGDVNLATGAATTFKMKAVIHELTHALGIAHIGPLQTDSLGNSLMGSTNSAYHKYYPNDNRVYLTKASAAILWKHPLFNGNYEDINTVPSVQMTNFQTSFNTQTNVIQVSGKLNSDNSAHSVVIANESANDKSDYWRKTFVGDIGSDGTFTCDISELNESSGKLIISFCFNNGAISGVTSKFGITKGIEKSYTYENNTYMFN